MAGWGPWGWATLFFLCSFGGWLWESAYATLQARRWVNRGFLRGPLLPIYGLGAVAVLAATGPVQGSPALVFGVGMGLAALLEYLSGAALYRLLGRRYWDYTGWPLNMGGYVCLPSALCWGFFSVGLVRMGPPLTLRLLELPGQRAALGLLGAAALADLLFSALHIRQPPGEPEPPAPKPTGGNTLGQGPGRFPAAGELPPESGPGPKPPASKAGKREETE